MTPKKSAPSKAVAKSRLKVPSTRVDKAPSKALALRAEQPMTTTYGTGSGTITVTVTHPTPHFTGTVTVLGTVVLPFTDGTASVTVPGYALGAIGAAGFEVTIGTQTPAPPYDANLDTLVSPIVSNAASATNAALRAAYRRRAGALWFPGGGTKATLRGAPSFFVKGINLGWKGLSAHDAWTTNWDLAWMQDGIDKIADLGANVVRIIGMYLPYSEDPVTYKSRFKALLEYARTKQLRVIYTFLNTATTPGELLSWTTYGAAYRAMVDDLIADYVGDKLIFAWDTGSELNALDATSLTVIQNLAPYIRSKDPGRYVTASQSPTLLSDFSTVMAAVEPYVDYHDVHFYQQPSVLNFGHGVVNYIASLSSKPVLIGELGASSNTASPGGPHSGGQIGQAAHIAGFRRHMVGGNVMGVMFWKIKDSVGNTTTMGLFDSAGAPTQQIPEVMAYPSVRLDAARDYVDYRPHPVLVDSFDRAASATVVGAPDIGPAPTVLTGTWGIKSSGGLYVGTKDGTTSDKIVWDCKTFQTPTFEAEFVVQDPTTATFGLLFYTTDGSNTYLYQFAPGSAGNYTASVITLVSATATTQWSGTVVGLASADLPQNIRLGIRMTSGSVQCSLFGKPITPPVSLSLGPTATAKRGVFIGPADTQTYVRGLQSFVRGRVL